VNYVLDGLRTEFPSFFGAVSRVRMPPLMRESPLWAFLSAHGAALVVGGILHLALLAAPRSITDPVIRWPFGATLASMITFFSSIVAGAVLVRAGGMRAVPFYVGFALAQSLVQLPLILRSCGQLGNDGACNVVYIAAGRAPEWLGVAIGIIAGMRMGRAVAEGPNRTLRGAGAFGIAQYAFLVPVTYASYGLSDQQLQVTLFLVAYALAGVIAGLVLRRAPAAAALLVALVVIAPTLGLSLPLLRNSVPGEPIEITFTRLGGLLAPALGGASLLGAWLLARLRMRV
jgi:hypothetical protein